MAATKTGKHKLSHKEREHKQVTKCLHQRLACCNHTGQAYYPAYEQYQYILEQLLMQIDCQTKGWKLLGQTSWKGVTLVKFTSGTGLSPQGWTPYRVIIEGMLLINCSPLRTTSTITEYATFLLNRFASPHYLARARDVHPVFDTSSTAVSFNPKCYEHARKDQSHNTDHHQHISFLPSTSIPHNWRTYIECITGYGHAGWLKCVHGNSLSMKMCTLPSPSRTKWVGFQWRWELFCWLGLPKAT